MLIDPQRPHNGTTVSAIGLVNVIGSWRWLGRVVLHDDGARSAEDRSEKASAPTLVAVSEIERGEDDIKAKYESALEDKHLLPSTRSLIADCYTSVKQGYDQMRHLKHSLESD